MTRSSKKGPFVDPRVVKKVQAQDDAGTKKPIKTWARNCAIAPEFVGHTFLVHTGNSDASVYVTESMVGHKLGEFAPTRKFRSHGGKAR